MLRWSAVFHNHQWLPKKSPRRNQLAHQSRPAVVCRFCRRNCLVCRSVRINRVVRQLLQIVSSCKRRVREAVSRILTMTTTCRRSLHTTRADVVPKFHVYRMPASKLKRWDSVYFPMPRMRKTFVSSCFLERRMPSNNPSHRSINHQRRS